MEFKEELISTLSEPASGIAKPAFDIEESSSGKISGFIISPTFKGMPPLERQNLEPIAKLKI